MKSISLNLGVIAAKTASVAVSLVLGMLVSVYLVGGWGSPTEEEGYKRRQANPKRG